VSRRWQLVAWLSVLGGCAAQSTWAPGAGPIELEAVPFFPQTEFQCGPAALATVLAHAGLALSADELTREVYVAGLRGSLQPELLAATRRQGLVPYVLDGDGPSLGAELASGRPVLVLQNLGVGRWPVWHYAVVVGLGERDVVLRSGAEPRRIERAARFRKSWERAGRWAMVVAPPGEIPASARPDAYVRAVSEAERLLSPAEASKAYEAAFARWPADDLVTFAAATRSLETGRLGEAEARYRALLERAPEHAAARNNLAHLLATRGCLLEARQEAERASAASAGQPALEAAIAETLAAIERGGESPRCL
jgi:hypothetical protein